MKKQGIAELASRHAERFVKESGVVTLPVDPIALAKGCGLQVVAKPATTKGASGMLIGVPNTNEYIIAYATHITNEGFRRFSIAHELGHFKLEGHCDALLSNESRVHQSRAGFASGDKYELEADHFAAGLLMPRPLFTKAMDRAGSGFYAIEKLHRQCQTSITSTAMRYAQLADVPVAIVMSSGESIDYWFASESFKRIPGIDWLRKGDRLPRQSATFKFNQDSGRVEQGQHWERSTTVRDWFGDGPDVELSEDIVGLGSYGRTLTVLFSETPVPDDDDAEDEALGDWNPKFR